MRPFTLMLSYRSHQLNHGTFREYNHFSDPRASEHLEPVELKELNQKNKDFSSSMVVAVVVVVVVWLCTGVCGCSHYVRAQSSEASAWSSSASLSWVLSRSELLAQSREFLPLSCRPQVHDSLGFSLCSLTYDSEQVLKAQWRNLRQFLEITTW